MICALTVDASKRLAAWFGGRRNDEGGVSKEYVARVKGEFPVYVSLVPCGSQTDEGRTGRKSFVKYRS